MPHDYREFLPHAALDRVVECYWTMEASPSTGEAITDLILPDGCIDILFDVGLGSEVPREPRVVGILTRSLLITTMGPCSMLGVRFRPGGASPFIPAEAHALTDGAMALEDLWGASTRDMWEKLVLAPGTRERLTALNAALLPRLERSVDRIDAAVLRASETVGAARGRATVDALAAAAGIGRRQLERRFQAVVGIGPKLSCTIARFREVVATLHREPATPLSRIAFRTGYADQPHMNRDFKRLAGVPPGAYRRSIASSTDPPDAFVQAGGGTMG